MKIITNDAVYVQKNDIAALNNSDLPIPASIFMKVYANEVTIIDDRNRFEFVKFVEKHEIDFFKNLDFILDYALVKDLDEYQIKLFLQKISMEIDELVEEYRSMSIEERKKNQAMVMKNEQLHYKCYSIIDYLNYKKGKITFNLPDGIDRPDFIKSKESGLRKVLSFFKK